MRALTGRSETGIWVVRSGDRLIGPFDGKTPARQFAKASRDQGLSAQPERLWHPADAREAMKVRQEYPMGVQVSRPPQEWEWVEVMP